MFLPFDAQRKLRLSLLTVGWMMVEGKRLVVVVVVTICYYFISSSVVVTVLCAKVL